MGKIFLFTLFHLAVYSSFIISQEIYFNEHLVDNNFLGPAGIFVFDVDRDLRNDIIAAGWNSNEIAWWHNQGEIPPEWISGLVIVRHDHVFAVCRAAGNFSNLIHDLLGSLSCMCINEVFVGKIIIGKRCCVRCTCS